MAKYGASDIKIFLVDGYNVLAAKVKELRDKTIAELERSDGLGDAFDESTPTGRASAELSQSGAFFDSATAGIHEALNGQQDVSRIVLFGYEGNVLGREVSGHAGTFGMAYERIASQQGLTKANVDYRVSGQKDDCLIVQPLDTYDGTHDSEDTPLDSAASSSGGLVAYLEVTDLDLDGCDDVTVTVRSSANGVDFSDLVAFSALTLAPGAQRVTLDGAIPRYLAVSVTYSGTPISSPAAQSIRYIVAVSRG